MPEPRNLSPKQPTDRDLAIAALVKKHNITRAAAAALLETAEHNAAAAAKAREHKP